jgi:hypothetical protein
MMPDELGQRADTQVASPGNDGDDTRPQVPGEAATTRFGMEKAEVPATGVDPEQQSQPEAE